LVAELDVQNVRKLHLANWYWRRVLLKHFAHVRARRAFPVSRLDRDIKAGLCGYNDQQAIAIYAGSRSALVPERRTKPLTRDINQS